MKLAITAVLSICLCGTSLGRLGEDLPGSMARYGQMKSKTYLAPECFEAKFSYGQVDIVANFYKGVCVRMEFVLARGHVITPPDEPPVYADAPPGGFSSAEVDALMSQNSQGHVWDKVGNLIEDKTAVDYKRDDGGFALWRLGGSLSIESPDFPAYLAETMKAEDGKDRAEAVKTVGGL
jgi:hypothetical protein